MSKEWRDRFFPLPQGESGRKKAVRVFFPFIPAQAGIQGQVLGPRFCGDEQVRAGGAVLSLLWPGMMTIQSERIPAMTAKRAIYAGLGVAAIVAIILFLASPIPSVILWLAGEELFPDTISWDGKTAWKRCDSAIAGKTSWPDTPQGACKVMHMCANEAPLNAQQTKLLYQTIRKTEGCQEP
jgi:MFS family permease